MLGEFSAEEQARWEELLELLKMLTVKAQVYLRHIHSQYERLYPNVSKVDPRPLVCTRLFASVCRVSKFVPAKEAWRYPFVEIGRTPTSYTTLVFDCDDPDRAVSNGFLSHTLTG